MIILLSFISLSASGNQWGKNLSEKSRELSTILNNFNSSIYVSKNPRCTEGGDIFNISLEQALNWIKSKKFDIEEVENADGHFIVSCGRGAPFYYGSEVGEDWRVKNWNNNNNAEFCFMNPLHLGLGFKVKHLSSELSSSSNKKLKNWAANVYREAPIVFQNKYIKQCELWRNKVKVAAIKYIKKIDAEKIRKEEKRQQAIVEKIKREQQEQKRSAQAQIEQENIIHKILYLNDAKNIEIIILPSSFKIENEYLKKLQIATFSSLDDFFNNLNITLEKVKNYGFFTPSVFHPKIKGEFEKTIAYENRIKKEEEINSIKNLQKKQKYIDNINKLNSVILNKYIGQPKLAFVNYNSDKESFSINIETSNSPYKVVAEYPYSISTARDFKTKISKGKPILSFSIINGMLTLNAAILVVNDEVLKLTNFDTPLSPIKFGSDAALSWEAKKKKEEQIKKSREKAQQEKYNNEQTQIINKLRKKYQHTGAFLIPNTIACDKIKSIHKAIVLSRIHSYIPFPLDCTQFGNYYIPITSYQDIHIGGLSSVTFSNGLKNLVSTKSIFDW